MKSPLFFAIGLIAFAALAIFLSVTFFPPNRAGAPHDVGSETGVPADDPTICAQVITPARDPASGDIREFPTPCDVPEGWEVIQNDIPDLGLDLEPA